MAKTYSVRAYLRFLLFSAFGIFAFFINFHLPDYTFAIGAWQWGTVAAQSNVLVSHFTNFVKAALFTGNFKAMPAVVWGIGVYSIVDLFVLRPGKFWHTTKVAATFAVFKIVGFLMLTSAMGEIYFGWHPGFMAWFFNPVTSLGEKSICTFIMNNILVSICISIPAASLFLPMLIDYGLVDFVGIIVRPFMRPVFRLPGRAAVITISAFLGNFSVGHIAVNDQYKSGRMTEREAVIIGTSLSTVSVGFLLVLANNTGLNERGYWNLYFWTTFLITLLVTVISVRIFPLRGVKDDYYEGTQPNPEPVIREKILQSAWREGLEIAQNQQGLSKRIAYIMKETLGVLGTVASGTAFFATAGVLLYTYTPIVRWVGYLFYPLMRIAIPAGEAVVASTGAAVSFIEVTIPALLVTVGEWSLRTRYMLAVIPVTSIIFLASFVPCLMATDVPVKFSHMVVIWLERMLLSVLITALFALVLFPASAM
ncbi:MAG: nucleoside recognition domain-containing protein [Oscillospiraceae bacterium]|nr:nucleoside recognition domain-containing protein [Oscillospiraceae bacterium]